MALARGSGEAVLPRPPDATAFFATLKMQAHADVSRSLLGRAPNFSVGRSL